MKAICSRMYVYLCRDGQLLVRQVRSLRISPFRSRPSEHGPGQLSEGHIAAGRHLRQHAYHRPNLRKEGI